MKLSEADRRVLALLGTRALRAEEIAADSDRPPEALAERLDELADNDLVSDVGDGRYARTESGRRVLAATGTGAVDERVDTSPEGERAIDGFGLRPDEADAVRHAFAFLRYWGRVTDEEIADAVYSEAPAGRDSPTVWWEEVIREPLAALPGVAPPAGSDEPWRYAGVPESGEPSTDGRRVLSRSHPVYGDAKHALESLDLRSDEREAARAAFGYLYRRGEATERELAETVYPEHRAGYDSPGEWLAEVVEPAFDALPRVERVGGGREGGAGTGGEGERAVGTTWRYRAPGGRHTSFVSRPPGTGVRVVVAGTFGPIHDGHRALFEEALERGDGGVVVGLSSDAFARETRQPDPRPIPPYEERKRSVAATLSELDRWGRDVEIQRIETEYGFADDDPDLDALVVSPETDETVAELNRRREERGMDPLEPIVVPYAYAGDGERISSTRIVAGEIDEHGNVLS